MLLVHVFFRSIQDVFFNTGPARCCLTEEVVHVPKVVKQIRTQHQPVEQIVEVPVPMTQDGFSKVSPRLKALEPWMSILSSSWST